MFERFAADVRVAVMSAAQEATVRRGESRLGSDHLLIGVVATGNDTARSAGLSVEGLHDALDRLDARAIGAVGLSVDHLRLGRPGRRSRRHLPFTRGAKSALERSLRVAIDAGDRQITSDHLLVGLAVAGPRDPAVRVLRACWIEPADLEAAARQSMARRAS